MATHFSIVTMNVDFSLYYRHEERNGKRRNSFLSVHWRVCVCVCKTALFDPLVGKWASDREWPGPLTLALDEGITACGRSPFFFRKFYNKKNHSPSDACLPFYAVSLFPRTSRSSRREFVVKASYFHAAVDLIFTMNSCMAQTIVHH